MTKIYGYISGITTIAITLVGCAGPTTPFGSVPSTAITSPTAESTRTEFNEDVAQGQPTSAAAALNPALATPTVVASPAPIPAPQIQLAQQSRKAIVRNHKNKRVKIKYVYIKRGKKVVRRVAQVRTTTPARLAVINLPPIRAAEVTTPVITFTPKHQVLHDKMNFTFTIDDPEGIAPDYKITLLYNGLDMTSKFLWQATKTNEGESRLRYTFKNLRLKPTTDNKIEVMYWHSPNFKPVYASLSPPYCSAFSPTRIASTGSFDVPYRLVATINHQAIGAKINPAYLAGLIAQESAFDEKAVSSAHALGLTQITASGEAEVIRTNSSWPRYPNINKMRTPMLRAKIMSGKINGQNEWRLNPELSVVGGLTYIQYLNDYWHRGSNLDVVAANYKDPESIMSQLILASYNSGPTRVNYALQEHGKRWLRDDDELNEARVYVRRVFSYCDHFSKQED